jgi:hypothetical protein
MPGSFLGCGIGPEGPFCFVWIAGAGQHKPLLGRNGILRMKVHLPAAIATNPDSSNVRVTRHCAGAAGRRLCGVIHERGDIGAEEDHMGIEGFDGSKGTLLMELPDERENLIAIHQLFFNIDEFGQEEFRQIGSVGVNIRVPEAVLLRDDCVWRIGSLSAR